MEQAQAEGPAPSPGLAQATMQHCHGDAGTGAAPECAGMLKASYDVNEAF